MGLAAGTDGTRGAGLGTERALKAVLVGLGSIGSRHLRNLRSLLPGAVVTIWHQRSSRSPLPVEEAGVVHVFDMESALANGADIALVTGPASLHISTASALAANGIQLFVEKPLSDRLEGTEALLEDCRRRGLVLMVGYNFRFYPPLQVVNQAVRDGRIGRILSVRAEVGQYLPEWRPGRDYRDSVTAHRNLGGGVLLELSHEIDYLRWIVGEVRQVTARVGRFSDLEIDVEDVAEILLDFENGAMGSVHLDMVQRVPTRGCRIVGSGGTLTWDGTSHQVRLYSAADQAWTELHPAAELDRNEMYLAELRHFLDCVHRRTTPVVSGEDGRRVLEIVAAARQSSDERRAVSL